MGLHQRRSFNLKLSVVMMTCLFGAAASGYFLYVDLTESGQAGKGLPMASVERREARVKRKPSTSYIWNNVQESEKLYRKDSLQTGPASAAAVKFNDGSVMEISENSLVMIDDITNLSLNFLRGSFILRRKEGDSKISVGKDGKAKTEELPIRLLKPDPLATLFTTEKEPKLVHFSWQVLSKQNRHLPEKFTIQVSQDRAFKSQHTLTASTEPGNLWETSVKVTPARYFWRVTDKGHPLTEPRAFTVSTASALRPVSPSLGQKVVIWGDDTPTQFRWVNPDHSMRGSQDSYSYAQGNHELEISRDPDFKSTVSREPISAASGTALIKKIPGGEFFWRIKSRYGDIAVTSQPEKFMLEKSSKLALALVKPDNSNVLNLPPQIHFSWTTGTTGAAGGGTTGDSAELEYLWELQTSDKKPVSSVKTRAFSHLFKKPDAGNYLWKVTALWQNKPVGETQWRSFLVVKGSSVTLRSPKNNEAIHYWEDPPHFYFAWDKDALAEEHGYQYEFEVAKDQAFASKIVSKKTRETNLSTKTVKIPPGSYFWKVNILVSTGEIVKSSGTFKLTYDLYPLLPPPTKSLPGTGEVFNLLEQEKNPVASWSEVPNAVGYELSLYRSDQENNRTPANAQATLNNKKPLLRTRTTKLYHEFKNLRDGGYAWTVRAIDRIKRPGEPLPAKEFTITYGEPLGAPEASSPEVQ